ncbi:MAG: winged helix-turn-helix domain-containing protein [Candidatus Aenigmarchaeota archaeon]|nr:winged helix-turn-helix domain-containing protein [Candidatus Aenigmarchaeota archaeon]
MVDELRIISSDTRLKILKELKDRPTTVSFLSKTLKKHVTTVSEHLDKLENAGLVERQQKLSAVLKFIPDRSTSINSCYS